MAAFVIAAYMKSVPMLYNGQEVGTSFRLTFPFTSARIDWTPNPEHTTEYKKIISLWNRSAVIRRGEPVSYTSEDVCAFVKEEGGEKVLVLVNVRNRPVTYTLQTAMSGNWKNAFSGKRINLGKTISLEPYQYLVVKR
jgi:glycosidase